MDKGWENDDHSFSFAALQENVELIYEWSDAAEKIVRYHQESRQLTWEYCKENVEKYLVPESVWFKFGNPPPIKMSEAVRSKCVFKYSILVTISHSDMIQTICRTLVL
jgi:hypothetical protein